MELLGLGVVLMLALGIVIFLTRGVFSRDLTQALKRVTQQEQTLQEQADILEQRLSQMEREYQMKLKRAETEAERLLQDAKSQAMNIRTAAIEEAKHRARQLLLEVEHSTGQLKAELAKELNGSVAQRTCHMLSTFLPETEMLMLHRILMDELFGALRRVDTKPLRGAVEQVQVTTARPLSAIQSQQLAEWASAAIGTNVPLNVETNPSVVAGAIVRIGSTILDNSLPTRISPR